MTVNHDVRRESVQHPMESKQSRQQALSEAVAAACSMVEAYDRMSGVCCDVPVYEPLQREEPGRRVITIIIKWLCCLDTPYIYLCQ